VGELLCVLLQPIRIELLDGESHDAVQRLAATFEHAVVGDVAGERVLEHEGELGMRRLLVDELQRAQLLDHGSQPVARLDDPSQQAQRKLASDHGTDLKRALGLPTEAIQARHQHFLDRPGYRDAVDRPSQLDLALALAQRAVLDERLHDLLDEERVSLGTRGDELVQRVGHARRLQHGLGHAPHLRLCEGLERQACVVAVIAEGMAVARAVAQQQQHPQGRHRTRHVAEELLRGAVDPVDVLDHQHEGRLLAEALETGADRAEGLAAPGGRILGVYRFVAAGKRQELAHVGQRPLEATPGARLVLFQLALDGGVVVGLLDPEASPQPVHDGVKGKVARVRHAAAFHPLVRLSLEAAPELVAQTRFADAGLPDQEDDLTLADGGRREGTPQSGQLVLAPDQRGEPGLRPGLYAAELVARLEHAVGAHRLGPSLHGDRPQIL